jgi:hypothetical protein
MLKIVDRVEGHLKAVLETGKLARHELSLMERAKQLAKGLNPWG